MWGRAFSQRQELNNSVARKFRQTISVSGFELGSDTSLMGDVERWHVGAVAGYSYGRLKFGRSGTGSDDSVHVGAYATFIGDSGFYADGIVRLARYQHAFNVRDDKVGARGKYRSSGVGASLELGKRFSRPSAWYVEPQVEMAVFRVQGGDYTTSSGLRVKDSGLISMLGRWACSWGGTSTWAMVRACSPTSS